MAKRWSDEQKSHMRRTRWTRGQRDSKSSTCTATRGRRCGGHKRDCHCAGYVDRTSGGVGGRRRATSASYPI